MIDENLTQPTATEETTKVAEPAKVEKVDSRTLSDKDAAIAGIISSQGDFPSIDVVEKRQNPFALPKECKPYEKRFVFKWISKDTRMLDRAVAKGWRVCNRTNNPWIPNHLIQAHGGVEKMGHILGYRPVNLNEAYRVKFQKKSNDMIRAATKVDEKDKDGSPYYTAKLSPEEEKGDTDLK